MNYVFFGSPEFAGIVLKELLDAGLPPLAVVTNPDRPAGRKKILTPPPVKSLAEKYKLKIFQPEKLDDDFVAEIKKLKPESFLVAAYSKILPDGILSVPPLGSVGVHPSLLPKHRGASPIQSAILSGDKETGVTLYILDEKVDHGPILAEKSLLIGATETAMELLRRLASLGGKLAAETLPEFSKGKIVPVAQNDNSVTFTKKFATEDAFVSEDVLANALSGKNQTEALLAEKMIRALNPDPGVWTIYKGKRVKLLEAELNDNGALLLKTIQIEGKTPQPAKVLF